MAVETNTSDDSVTLDRIAELAGVSKTTVSFVLNNRPSISTTTRDKVLGIMEELGYHPAERSTEAQLVSLIEPELKRSIRYEREFSILLIEMSRLPGRRIPSKALRDVEKILRKNLRAVDSLTRCGARRFLALLPETGLEGVQGALEKVRRSLSGTAFPATTISRETSISFSIGYATFPMDGETAAVLGAMAARRARVEREVERVA